MDDTVSPPTGTPAFVAGESEMARRICEHDWAATPLGSIEGWPPHLRTAVDIMLHVPGPLSILWGPERIERIQLYNDPEVSKRRHRTTEPISSKEQGRSRRTEAEPFF